MGLAFGFEIKKLVLATGKCPFDAWFKALGEDDQVMVDGRLARVRQGSLGEMRSLGDAISEFKFRKGRALRIYYAQVGRRVILLIGGGDKKTQKRDIAWAKMLFREYKKGAANYEGH
jgi:putative addiction module killer protein